MPDRNESNRCRPSDIVCDQAGGLTLEFGHFPLGIPEGCQTVAGASERSGDPRLTKQTLMHPGGMPETTARKEPLNHSDARAEGTLGVAAAEDQGFLPQMNADERR